jgi:ribosomal protein L7Ae-like RNA K-turn-binding protein
MKEERLQALRDKLKARKGRPGLEENVKAIEEEIARLEAKDGD